MQLLLDAELPLDLQKGNRSTRVIRRGRVGIRALGATDAPSTSASEIEEDSGYESQSAEDGGDGAARDRGCTIVGSSDIRGVVCVYPCRAGGVRGCGEIVESIIEGVGWSRGCW